MRFDHFDNEKRASPGYIAAMVKEAVLAGLWIEIKKKMYAPEEVSEMLKAGTLVLLDREEIKLKDPDQALRKVDAYIREVQRKREEFAERIRKYKKK